MSPVFRTLYHLGFTLAHDMTNLLPCAALIAAGLIYTSSVQTSQGPPTLPENVAGLLGVF